MEEAMEGRRVQSKEELRYLTINQKPIHASLEAIDVLLLRKDRLRPLIPHLRHADKEALMRV